MKSRLSKLCIQKPLTVLILVFSGQKHLSPTHLTLAQKSWCRVRSEHSGLISEASGARLKRQDKTRSCTLPPFSSAHKDGTTQDKRSNYERVKAKIHSTHKRAHADIDWANIHWQREPLTLQMKGKVGEKSHFNTYLLLLRLLKVKTKTSNHHDHSWQTVHPSLSKIEQISKSNSLTFFFKGYFFLASMKSIVLSFLSLHRF